MPADVWLLGESSEIPRTLDTNAMHDCGTR